MKTINEYVFDKTISSIDEYLLGKNKTMKSPLCDTYYIVHAWGRAFDNLLKHFNDKSRIARPGIIIFILDSEEIDRFYDKGMFDIYEIPKEYTDMEKLVNDLQNETLDFSVLGKIAINEVK